MVTFTSRGQSIYWMMNSIFPDISLLFLHNHILVVVNSVCLGVNALILWTAMTNPLAGIPGSCQDGSMPSGHSHAPQTLHLASINPNVYTNTFTKSISTDTNTDDIIIQIKKR